ncbi:hypothetical protein Lesp02_30490 [Lentzea sp. NBRC 105346]|nr:hypothetical protein Lesp02_30490 [Lentzea sp. NBRC 105346]
MATIGGSDWSPVAEGADRPAFGAGVGSTGCEMRAARELVMLFVLRVPFPAAHSCPFDGRGTGEKLFAAWAAGRLASEDGSAARVFNNGFHDCAFHCEASH